MAENKISTVGDILTPEGLLPASAFPEPPEADVGSIRAEGLQWARVGVQPNVAAYVTNGHRLFVTIQSFLTAVSLRISGFLQRTDGHVDEINQVISGDASVNNLEVIIELNEGFLLGVSAISLTPGTGPGNTFCQVAVARGSVGSLIAPRLLISRYLPCGQFVGWPGHTLQNSLEGPGDLHVFTVAQPFAGDPVIITVPTGERWKIIGANVTFAASSQVANRTASMRIDIDNVDVYSFSADDSIVADDNARIVSGAGTGVLDATGLNYFFPLPSETVLPAGTEVITTMAGIQSMDQFSALNGLTLRWLERD